MCNSSVAHSLCLYEQQTSFSTHQTDWFQTCAQECINVNTPRVAEGEFDQAGMCTRYPSKGAYIFNPAEGIPFPVAYFPFNDANVDSWPFPTYRGTASVSAGFTDDPVFGIVLDCNQVSTMQRIQIKPEHLQKPLFPPVSL